MQESQCFTSTILPGDGCFHAPTSPYIRGEGGFDDPRMNACKRERWASPVIATLFNQTSLLPKAHQQLDSVNATHAHDE